LKRFAPSPLSATASIVCVSLVAGCSSGGGAPGPAPTIRPTPVPQSCATAQPSPPPASGLSTFAIASIPTGLCVQLGAAPLGATPQNFTPDFSRSSYAITIVPGNGAAAFVYVADQKGNGDHTVLYDQAADTSGSIGSISTASLGRLPQSATSAANELRIPPLRIGQRPAYSSTRLAVHYRLSALRANPRAAADVERVEGIPRAVDVGFARNGEITRALDVPAGRSIDALAANLRQHPEVASVELLGLRYPVATTPVTPNDTYYDQIDQWDMFRIGAPNAWGYTKGSPGVPIAVIDTGADFNHPDLSNGKITYSERVLGGVVNSGTKSDGTYWAQDSDGHGTNVAGIAAADTNNGFGYAGAGFNTSLQIYDIFPPGSGPAADTADEAQAIDDALAHGARVINLSLGSPQGTAFDSIESAAVENALGQGVAVVAAAGNEAANTLDRPAAYSGVIAVGASALDDSALPGNPSAAVEYVAGYSNMGPGLTLVAPGGDPSLSTVDKNALHWIENIYSSTVAPPHGCSNPADCRAFIAGTSQAAAHVSGTVALMLAENANLRPAAIAQILESTADDIRDPGQGHGRLNAYRALAAVSGDPQPPSPPTNLNFVAFAYSGGNGNRPNIIDASYPRGIAVSSGGTFRIADIPAGASNYRIAVWADVNGDGIVDAGDYFGYTPGTCSASAPCSGANGIVAHPVGAGFSLP
jgi:subtilisin family serine protease